jgi:hypothetical protein
MFTRGFVSLFVLPIVAGAIHAQQSLAHFEAAVVVADNQTRFQQLGDINGDGFADAFSAWWVDNQFNQISIAGYINDKHGRLVHAWTTTTLVYPTNTSTWSFAAGDVNHDGLCDLVAGVGKYVSLHLTGPGGSAPSSPAYWSTTGPNVTGVALLDVDGDGIMEIAILSGDLHIVKYTPGSTVLTEIASLALGANGGELRVGDLDGRGGPDLLAWDATRVWMIPMNGAVPETPTMFLHGCGDPRGAIGDIDNDGDQDVVVFDLGKYAVFRRTGPATFVQEPLEIGGPARFLYDVDGDGYLDGVCCGGGGPSPVDNDTASIFRIALNDGTGHFAPALEMPGLGSIRLAGAADLDHDGTLDLVAGRCVFYSPAKLLDNLPRALPFTARTNAFADFDGDRDPDLEPGMITQRNLGDGTLEAFTPVLPTPPAGRTWIGPGYPIDFDGDGNIDLIVSQQLNGTFEQMELLKNAGGGSYVDAGPAGPPGLDFTFGGSQVPRARDAIVADIDGDGDLDLIVTLASQASTKVFLNDGAGHFTAGPSWSNQFLARYVADMNGDGIPDLIGHFRSSGGAWDIQIKAGLGGGNFAPGYDLYFSNTQTGANDLFDIGDYDRDGDLDIVGADAQDLFVFRNDSQPGGSMNFQAQVVLGQAFQGNDLAPRGALFTDFDGDGKLDIVAWPVSTYTYDAPNASFLFHRKSDNSGYDPPTYQVMTPTGHLDVDGDGDEDLIGAYIFKNRRFENTTGGVRKQAAGGIPGTGGIVPTLGASGPFRVGLDAQMVLTGALGGVQGLWYQHFLGEQPPPFTGGHHAGQSSLYYPPAHFTTSGTPGAAGEGKWTGPFVVPPSVAGTTKVYFCTLHDPGAVSALARSNDLYITYGP